MIKRVLSNTLCKLGIGSSPVKLFHISNVSCCFCLSYAYPIFPYSSFKIFTFSPLFSQSIYSPLSFPIILFFPTLYDMCGSNIIYPASIGIITRTLSPSTAQLFILKKKKSPDHEKPSPRPSPSITSASNSLQHCLYIALTG